MPLLRHALTDPRVERRARRIDERWGWSRLRGHYNVGFAPWTGCVFHAAHSVLATWLSDPTTDLRPLNAKDRLVWSLLYLVHDYLHVWAYQTVNDLEPRLQLGWGQVTADRLEELAFAHLLSEAVAVVGLDYWYLAAIELRDVLPCGTAIRTFATPYHEDDGDEFRRTVADLDVQTPAFLGELTAVYCTGAWPGLDETDLLHSPLTARWLLHELVYGQSQRDYTRRLLRHFLREPAPVRTPLDAPVVADRPWQRELTEALAALLWRKVKHGDLLPPRFDLAALCRDGLGWQSPDAHLGDLRFVNLNWLLAEGRAAAPVPEAHELWLAQSLWCRDHARFDPELADFLLDRAVTPKLRPALLQALLRDQPLLPETGCGEPRDLFFLT
jgi:hypothetical protein